MRTEMLILLGGTVSVALAAPQFDFDNQQPVPYEFAYGVNNGDGDQKEHKESVSSGGLTEGEYRWLQPNGLYSVTRYTADGASGFRATVRQEPGEEVGNYYRNSLAGIDSSGGVFVSQNNQPSVTTFQRVTNTQSSQAQRPGNSQNQVFNIQTSSPAFQNVDRGQSFQTFSTRPIIQNQSNRGQNFQTLSIVNNQDSTANIIDGGIIDGGIIDGGVIDGGITDGGVIPGTNTNFVTGSTSSVGNTFGSSGTRLGSRQDNRGVAVILASDNNRFRG